MKCPKCGNIVLIFSADIGPVRCPHCGTELKESAYPRPCQHEPANFTVTHGLTVSYCAAGIVNWEAVSGPGATTKFKDDLHTSMPFYVCRLCGVFYTDMEAVVEGEKKYKEAMEE